MTYTTRYSTAAKKLESDEAYLSAADLYIRSAFERISDTALLHNKQPMDADSTERHMAISDLQRAIFCLIRAENDDLAQSLNQLLIAVSEIIEYGIEDEVLSGLIYEWIGDSHFLISSGDSSRFYDKARDAFERADDESLELWEMEPEAEQSYWTFIDYLKFEGYSSPSDEIEFLTNPVKRIKYKLSLVESRGA